MINGLGIAGWGVGGIEAEAGMLGQPLYFLTPTSRCPFNRCAAAGHHATDLALTLTHLLRQTKVVGNSSDISGKAPPLGQFRTAP
jgi:aconitate hydratase